MNFRYDKNGYYTQEERELTILFMKNKIKQDELPFNLLPESLQKSIMNNLNAFFPTECPNCNRQDEAAFLSNLGVTHCQHCGFQVGFVPVANLPTIQDIKMRIWQLCGNDMAQVNEIGLPDEKEGWLGWWNMYLKARNK